MTVKITLNSLILIGEEGESRSVFLLTSCASIVIMNLSEEKKGNFFMFHYRTATNDDIAQLMQIRIEMLRAVNHLPPDYIFSEELLANSRDYFLNGQHTTILAFDQKAVIGRATLCYIEMMPTFSHPTGKRAHLMNVYTNSKYRRQGIARHMLTTLIHEAKCRGVTEISLDATDSGRPLYQKLGFQDSGECMVLVL